MRLQDDLNSICGWSIDWKVFLNALKCAYLHFSLVHSESQAENEINNLRINYSTSYQDLGILVNSTMSWSDHTHAKFA